MPTGIHVITGRPTIYSDSTAVEICDRLASGETMVSITTDDHMPSRTTVADWVLRPPVGGELFPALFARARELGCDALVDKALHMAMDGSRDYGVDSEGVARVDHDHIARTKLICEQIRWTVSKIYRRQYGDDGLFAGLAASGGKVTVSIETVGAPAVEPPTYTADAE